MPRHLPFLLVLLLPLLGGCGRDTPGSTTDRMADTLRKASTGELPEMDGLRTETADGPSFADWKGRLDELLTLDMAAAAAGLPADLATTKHVSGVSVSYLWKGPRTQRYGNAMVPVRDSVSLTPLMSGVTREFFLSRFTELTDSQKAEAAKALDEQLGDSDQDPAIAQAAKGLMGAMSKRHPIEHIPDLGDAAVWETRPDGQTLYLYHNASTANLVVNVSDDPQVNKAATIALARQLIERL